jgi:CheY-like chemotaxis protein
VLEEYVPEDISVPPSNTLSLHSEIERVQRQTAISSTSAEGFLRNTLNALKHLQERQEADLDVQILDAILPSTVDQTVLRQVIIWIISQLLIQSPLASRFTISFMVKDSTARFCFTRNCELGDDRIHHLPQNLQPTLETLLSELGATMYTSDGYSHAIEIILEIPCQQYSILVIDDNPDVTSLFRQYLAGQPYQVFTAIDGAQAVELASQIHPQFIILDVLLPKQDGWEILQKLKNHPTTLTTPVLICSVLDAQDLAILLGADGFLHKPPEQSEFLETLNRLRNILEVGPLS